MEKKKKITPYQLCLVAMAVGINVAGGQLALMLRLPIYLDSVGTIFIGAFLGPWFGILPNPVFRPGRDGHRLYDRACVEKMAAKKGAFLFKRQALAFCSGSSYSRHVHKLRDLCRSVWRDHVIGLHDPGAASGQDPSGHDGQYFCDTDSYRLWGQGDKHGFGGICFTDTALCP